MYRHLVDGSALSMITVHDQLSEPKLILVYPILFGLFRWLITTGREQKTQRDSTEQQPRKFGSRVMVDDSQRVLRSVDKVCEQHRGDNASQHSSRYSETGCYGHYNCQANQRQRYFKSSLMEEQRQDQSN